MRLVLAVVGWAILLAYLVAIHEHLYARAKVEQLNRR